MSVIDEFRAAERRVTERLEALQPLVAEYRQLEEIAKRLEIDVPHAGESAPRRSRRRRTRTRTRASERNGAPPGRHRASAGQRDRDLIDVVRRRPGVTVRQAAQELGVDPTGLYRVVHRLEQRGELRKDGRSLEPGSAGR